MKNLQQKIFNRISKYLPAVNAVTIIKPNIGLALSGGVDSMVLLHILQQPQMKLLYDKLVAIHFNHGLRGLSADDDEAFLINYCANFQIDFYSEKIAVIELVKNSNKTVEEAARELRYEKLSGLKDYYKLEYIFLAHHADDKAETVFFNIMRGCGLQGLSALKERNNFYLRPLLGVLKNEIIKYAEENHIQFREDFTNRENDYSRNKIRNILFPQIELSLKRNIRSSLLKLSVIAEETYDFVTQCSNQVLADTQNLLVLPDKVIIKKNYFLTLHSCIGKEILSRLSSQLGCRYHLDFYTAELLYNKILSENSFRQKWQDLEYVSWKNFIYIGKVNQSQKLHAKIDYDIGNTFMDSQIILSKDVNFASQYSFSAQEIKGEIYAVNLQNAALFIPFGHNKFSSISKILSEKKIPVFLRDKLFMLVDSEKVLFILGVGIDNRVRVTNSCTEIIKVYVKNYILDFVKFVN